MVLMRAAVQLSYDEGFHGRVGLHALPQAEEFTATNAVCRDVAMILSTKICRTTR